MANNNSPFGAWPIAPIKSVMQYDKGTNLAIYPGDFVSLKATGDVRVSAAGDTQIAGVCAGYQAAADTTVLVFDDPEQEYYIQDDGVAATLAQTNVGNNFDLVATVGNSTTIRSKHQLDTSDTSGTATANLRLLGFHPSDSIGKYVRCRVVINEHAFGKTTTGV